MKANPLVSILIPAYNAGEWLGQSIESALNQTWPAKEIIVVDDGSTDRTFDVARDYVGSGVILHQQKNAGASTARNKAFSLSSGSYIQWLDADDMLHPKKIAEQMSRLLEIQDEHALISSAWGKFFYRKEKARFTASLLWADLSPCEWLTRKMESGAHMQTATWLISRSITEAAGPWDVRLSGDDDGEYFCRVLLQSNMVYFAPESRVYYRMTDSGRLSNFDGDDKKLDSLFASMQVHIRCLLSLGESQRVRGAIVRYLQKYMFDFHPERSDIVLEMEKIAGDFGGKLQLPKSRLKYALIEALLGWRVSKRAQFYLPSCKNSFLQFLDKILFRIEKS